MLSRICNMVGKILLVFLSQSWICQTKLFLFKYKVCIQVLVVGRTKFEGKALYYKDLMSLSVKD